MPSPGPTLARAAAAALSVIAMAATGFALLPASPAAAQPAPPPYREDGPYLLVCTGDAEDFAKRNEEVAYNQRIVNARLYPECVDGGHRDLASALDAVSEPGTRVLILPGHYTLEQTAVVDGGENLQIEGLGDGPEDIRLSARFAADAVLEARGATGLYLKGFTVSQGTSTGLFLDGVAGATVEDVAGEQNGETGLRIADSDAVAITACRAEANDTAGIAIEHSDATADDCESTGNLVGLLVTGGGQVSVTGNRLHGNTTGLVVTDTADGAALDATGNHIHDNNADHYARLGTDACEVDLAARAWSEGVLCPGESVPSGVGVLVAAANDNRFAGNHIWDQETAAVMVWGEPGLSKDASHRNRFERNTFGYRADGQRARNRLDLWWDGTGEGNCFDEPTAEHATPAVVPSCDGGPGPARLIGDPVRAVKIWRCGTGVLADDAVPSGCNWFGATFSDRLEFQIGVVFAAGLLFLTGAGWFGAARSPNPPPPGTMTFSAIATAGGGLLMILATWSGRADYEALAIGLWGLGWLLAGRSWFASGMQAFGGFTAIIGGLAVLDAIDRGVWIVPVMPFSPAWMWVILLPLWMFLAIGAAYRRYPDEDDGLRVERTPVTAPAHDRFDW